MEQKFKQGDIVILKSGGPKMTVVEYEKGMDILSAFTGEEAKPDWDTDIVRCTWFDKNTLRNGKFKEGLLELATS